MDFTNATIGEVDFPALDASNKEPAFFTVKIHPETTLSRPASGTVQHPIGPPQKVWLPGNFRLTIGGLDTTHVSKVDAIAIKWSPFNKVEVDPLGFTLSDAFSKTWRTYFTSFVEERSGEELTGKLEVLNQALDTTLASVDFGHMGIYMLDPTGPQPSAGIKRLKAEMYCEEIAFTYGAPT